MNQGFGLQVFVIIVLMIFMLLLLWSYDLYGACVKTLNQNKQLKTEYSEINAKATNLTNDNIRDQEVISHLRTEAANLRAEIEALEMGERDE